MSAVQLLVLIAVLQAVVFFVLLIAIVLNRWVRSARHDRLTGPRGEFERAIQAWLLGTAGADWVLARLRRLPTTAALDLVVHYSARVPPDQWTRLAGPLASEPWARALRKGARSPRWTRRLDAARIIAATGLPTDVPALIRLLGDPNPSVVISALSALERVTTPSVVGAALNRLPSLPRPLRAYLAAALGGARVRAGLLPLLTGILDGPRGRPGLEAFADLAGRLGDPALRAPLSALHDHPNAEIRTAVARALARFPHPDSVRVLRVLAADSAWTVRAQAVMALSRLAEPDIGIYREGLRDPAWWVRLRSAVALAKAGRPGRDALLAAEIGADPLARDMARFVLGLAPNTLLEYQA